MGKLTAKAVEAARPKDKLSKLSDGKGLQLWIYPDGAKRWRFSYRFGGKQRTLALGVYNEISLAKARGALDEARVMLAKGVDPAQVRATQKATGVLLAAESFEAVGREWFSRHMEEMSDSYRVRTRRILEKDLYPQLGRYPVAEIEPPVLLAALRKIEARSVDIAHRAKQTAGQVFRYAIATGRAPRDPTRDLTGALKSKHKKHHAAITDPSELGKLLLAIDGYTGSYVVKVAMLINGLTFQRPGLVRAMEWEHVDLDEGVWSVPAEAMQKTHKAGGDRRAHVVPLSTQAVALLRELHNLTGRGRYAFPNGRGPSRPLSENGMRAALRTLGYTNDQMTSHGWRATARTLLDEELKIRVDYIEHQLAHAVKDPNGRAYNRTNFLQERSEMMQNWADYLDALRAEVGGGSS
ncbi:MAG: integrase arm-type DNA-binding domain-containing protein [Pseudomonadota bacterium]